MHNPKNKCICKGVIWLVLKELWGQLSKTKRSRTRNESCTVMVAMAAKFMSHAQYQSF
jgi:hypothetical protein